MDVPERSGLPERFWAKVQINESTGCWEWTGAVTGRSGYGNFQMPDGMRGAHRLAWVDCFGPIPDGLQLDHLCHNRACVRPDHLRIVTNQQNAEHKVGARSDSRTGVRGVRQTPGGRYQARVGHNGKRINGGTFDTIDQADAAARELRSRLFTHDDFDTWQALARPS